MPNPLDLGVCIPTRNAMPGLRQHVEDLNAWIAHAKQVVVVDSESTDGTSEYLQEHLRHPNIQFLQHPPGLYPSWNAGIQAIDTKYTYVATINDRISFEGIEKLYAAAETTQASVVLSPPDIISETGERLEQDWPIHHFIEQFVNAPTYRLAAAERLVFSALYLPGTLIGSSASNLYLTSVLQESPFSSEYGHAGDSAWAISRPHHEKWLIVNDVLSQFVLHAKSGQHRDHTRACRVKLYALATQQMDQLLKELPADAVELLQAHVSTLTQLWVEKESVMVEYKEISSATMPWYLRLRGWQVRQHKIRIRKQLAEVHARIVESLCAIKTAASS